MLHNHTKMINAFDSLLIIVWNVTLHPVSDCRHETNLQCKPLKLYPPTELYPSDRYCYPVGQS